MRYLHAAGLGLVVFLAGAAGAPVRAETVELEIGGHLALADLEAPGEGALDGPVALLVHGTFAHKDQETVEAMQAALADLEIASLAVTLTLGADRREGILGCEGTHEHRHDDAVAEIAAWVDWLGERGASDVVLVGHSRGGAQAALYLAGETAEPVRGAALLAPATEDGDAAARSYGEGAGTPLAEVLDEARAGAPDAVLEVPGFVYCRDARATAASFLSYHGPDVVRDTPALLAQGLGVPVLVIAAGADEVVTDLPERMAPLADGETIRFETIADADHRFLDFYALDAADLVADFVAAVAQD